MQLQNHDGLFVQPVLKVNGSAQLDTETTASLFTAAVTR